MSSEALNAICPYYTMFPLSFPLRVIGRRRAPSGWIADPFCGRGTTNLGARLVGSPTYGIDSSPIAVAIALAKMCSTTVDQVLSSAKRILEAKNDPADVPSGEFWSLMYRPAVLRDICRLREAFLDDCRSDARKVLRAIIMGALHGPSTKQTPSHLSNQSPRTYAPKPKYAVGYWRERGLRPPEVNIYDVIRTRAQRYLADCPGPVSGTVVLGDSRRPQDHPDGKVGLVITSPPYYGMRTYIPDQWLRSWFLGGPAHVDYKPTTRELAHSSPDTFAGDLRSVWAALATRATSDARLVVRFGGINDRNVDPVDLMKESLRESGWRLTTVLNAGDADRGRRQARQFLQNRSTPKVEHDFYAVAC